MARTRKRAAGPARVLPRRAAAAPVEGGAHLDRRAWRASEWWLLPALIVLVAVAYQPAWQGGLLWDDAAHVTPPALRSVSGLWRVWTDIGATQQYYPLAHTAFWIQHRLWGDSVVGYHLVNIVLHACSAWLLVLILRRLVVPGAVLAALAFALHPVHVESVAWISELKNTLSGAFYLTAALAYLRFDDTRATRDYLVALLCFTLALLTKTVTATLPVTLILVFWWRRGRVSLARDVRPLAPWIVLGAAAGVFTAWVERTVIGAQGAGFDLGFVERVLVAGRAVWFYLGKLLWPANLTFIYPRWEVNASAWWQYLFPLAALGLAAALWALRGRSRAPAAAFGIFLVTLFPALGFLNVYPFRYTFVADHFQYLASIPILALAVAAVVSWVGRPAVKPAAARAAAIALVVVLFGSLTWAQSRDYVDAERLYRATIARSPTSWMAHNNLALLLVERGRVEEGREHLAEALRLNPGAGEHHLNMGRLLLADGSPREALPYLQAAVRLDPLLPSAQNNLGVALMRLGRLDEAVSRLSEAVRLRPDHAEAHANLADALFRVGRPDEAEAHVRTALGLDPDLASALVTAGLLAMERRNFDEARVRFTRALERDPASIDAAVNLGEALQQLGRLAESRSTLERAVRIDVRHAPAQYALGVTMFRLGRVEEAIGRFSEALRLDPQLSGAENDLGAALLSLDRLGEAIPHLEAAVALRPDHADAQFNLAHALHAAGRLREAIARYGEAVRANPSDAALRNDFGMALLAFGRRDEAAREFTEALRLRPDLAAARAGLERTR